MIDLRWRREVEVRVGNLVISEPEIFGTAAYSTTASQNQADLSILNLSPEHVGLIEHEADEGGSLLISAGYPSTKGVIFSGVIKRVRQGRRIGGGQYTEIRGGDAIYTDGLPRPGGAVGTSSRSYGQVLARAVARDLAGDAGLEIRNLEAIPADAVADGFVWAGQTAPGLTKLLAPLGLGWYMFDGRIVINRPGSTADGPRHLVVSPETGMIGSPVLTEDGAEVTMFLNPGVGIGDMLRLVSRFVGDDWKVVALRHTFSNRQGEFTTWADLRALAT